MSMNKLHILLLVALMAAGIQSLQAQKITLLGTNDTHSQVDPNERGVGGALQRKAIIDSVRRADRNVLLVDAGDAVQGQM